MTLIAVFFAYYKLRAYMRDSKTKSQMLEHELKERQDNHFKQKWNNDFTK